MSKAEANRRARAIVVKNIIRLGGDGEGRLTVLERQLMRDIALALLSASGS